MTRRWAVRLGTCGLALVVAACGEPETEPGFTRTDTAGFAVRDTSAASTGIRFRDVTAEAGITFTHETGAFGEKWMPETMGSGAAWFDYDGDGWPDLFLVNGTAWPGQTGAATGPALYRNLGGEGFEDVTDATGLAAPIYGMGAAAADYDADGDPDLYVTAVGTNRLYRNDGGRFVDVTAEAGVTGNRPGSGAPPAWSTAAAWLDADLDGWLDLYVCNYVQWTPETDLFTTLDGVNKSYATPQQYEGESCRYYRGQPSGRFEDRTREAGLENPDGKSLGIVVEDFNDDGRPDLAVANDTYRNFYYLNQGDGTFIDRAVEVGVGLDEFGRARAGMGIDAADVTGRGRLSIAIGNFSNEAVSLYTQIGPDMFQDLAGSARITRPTLSPLTFGVAFVDVDLDMDPDLLLANGHIEPDVEAVQEGVTFEQRPQLLLNTGSGQFHDVSGQVGPDWARPAVGRGLAIADYDRDGDPDVLLTVNGGPARLLRNEGPPPDATWMRVELEGAGGNTAALGAVVRVFAAGRSTRQAVRTTASYLSQSEVESLLFGLDRAEQADSVRVRWPGGAETRHGTAPAGRTLRLRAPEPPGGTAGDLDSGT